MHLSSVPSIRERLALFHAGFLCVGMAWTLGGIGPFRETIFAFLAAPALLLTLAEARWRLRHDRAGLRRLLLWLCPMAGLAVLLTLSALNPSHVPVAFFESRVFRPLAHVAWLPSSPDPGATLRLGGLFLGLYLAGLNLAFCVQSTHALRRLISILAVNAFALSVLGTLQRQAGAAGPFFGAWTAPSKAWFATFLYHNHWCAFALLGAVSAIGLAFLHARYSAGAVLRGGPAPFFLLCAVLIAATAPLTTSRSGTVLMVIVGLLAVIQAARLGRRGHPRRLFFGALGLAAALGLMVWLGGDTIAARWQDTLGQLEASSLGATNYGRTRLYEDTWRMAAAHPWFGWGLESYGPIFRDYCTFRPGPDGLWIHFVDAHSDWLQSLAEIGFVGTGLLLLSALIPLGLTIRRRRLNALAGWLLTGCALVVAYAWLEFPFANPAVVGTWWTLFFAALRIHQLTPSHEAGPVSPARPAATVPPSP